MALDATILEDLIDAKYALINADYAASDSRTDVKEGLFRAIAQAIVEHITTDARATGTDSPTGDSHDLAIV